MCSQPAGSISDTSDTAYSPSLTHDEGLVEFSELPLFEREQFERNHLASMSEELLDSLIARDWCVIRTAAALQYSSDRKIHPEK